MVRESSDGNLYWLEMSFPDSSKGYVKFETIPASTTKLREFTKINLKFTQLNQWASTLCGLFTFLIAN